MTLKVRTRKLVFVQHPIKPQSFLNKFPSKLPEIQLKVASIVLHEERYILERFVFEQFH